MVYIPEAAEWLTHTANRMEWLNLRRTGIGASEIAGVLGAGRWCSALSVHAEKIDSDQPVDDRGEERMQLGILLEPVILQRYARVTGRKVAAYGHLLRSKKWPWMLATLDGLAQRSGTPTPVEVKNTQDRAGWSDGLPRDVWIQIQQQLAVTDLPLGSVAVLIAGCEFKTVDVKRDQAFIHDILVPAGEKFWANVKARGAPPQADGSDASLNALKRMFPECDNTTVVLHRDFFDHAEELTAIKEQQKVDKARRSELENLVRQSIGSATFGAVPDGGEFSNKADKNGTRTLRYRKAEGEA